MGFLTAGESIVTAAPRSAAARALAGLAGRIATERRRGAAAEEAPAPPAAALLAAPAAALAPAVAAATAGTAGGPVIPGLPGLALRSLIGPAPLRRRLGLPRKAR